MARYEPYDKSRDNTWQNIIRRWRSYADEVRNSPPVPHPHDAMITELMSHLDVFKAVPPAYESKYDVNDVLDEEEDYVVRTALGEELARWRAPRHEKNLQKLQQRLAQQFLTGRAYHNVYRERKGTNRVESWQGQVEHDGFTFHRRFGDRDTAAKYVDLLILMLGKEKHYGLNLGIASYPASEFEAFDLSTPSEWARKAGKGYNKWAAGPKRLRKQRRKQRATA